MMKAELLRFEASPKGYYYGGVEHFKEDIQELILKLYAKMQVELPEAKSNTGTSLPMHIFVLLADNTCMRAMSFITNPDQKTQLATAIRYFVTNPEFEKTTGMSSKPVALIVTTEAWFAEEKLNNDSDAETERVTKEFKAKSNSEKASVIMFNLQFNQTPEQDELIIYDITDAGESNLRTKLQVGPDSRQQGIFSNLFIPFTEEQRTELDKNNSELFLSPRDAAEFVSKVIRQVIDAKDSVIISLDEDGIKEALKEAKEIQENKS